jgi:hypothetical protein
MKHIKLFENFQKSNIEKMVNDFFKKVQIYCSLNFQDAEEEIGDDMKNYWVDFYERNKFNKIDKELPLLFWRNPKRSKDLLKNGDLPKKSLIYNHPSDFDPGKKDLAKKALDKKVDWFPKTVFNKQDLKTLRFPIIAKKDDSYQSKGVEKIDSIEQLGNKKFDVYQECIPIQDEYRIMLFKGNNDQRIKAFGVWCRTPNNKKSKSLRVNEAKEKEIKSKFIWEPIDINLFPYWSQIKPIAQSIFDFYPNLNFVGLDVAIDNENKAWCIEHNETPGLVGNASIRIYKYIFEDCFGTKMPSDIVQILKDKAKSYAKTYKKYDYVEIPDGDHNLIDLDSEIIL